MLQAMNTGHDGSMTTIHANGISDAINRLEMLAGFAGYNGSEVTLRGQIVSGVELLVHVSRLPHGARRLMAVSEITGLKNGEVQIRHLFRYNAESDRIQDLRSQEAA